MKPTDVEHKSAALSAGPIRLKFEDGELRYLYVGDREIVRRIYFAVRNAQWATSTPVFSRISIHRHEDSFTIDLDAVCKTEGVDYKWSGHIIGTSDGRIVFTTKGESGEAFRSNRIGLCILFGAPALAGHAFETNREGEIAISGRFPALVSPQLIVRQFNTLAYRTDEGLIVSTTIDGTRFDMEDQRTYGDSSFKAYAPLTYTYPDIPARTAATETVTLKVQHASPDSDAVAHEPSDHVKIKVGDTMPDARIPKIETLPASTKAGTFGEVNNQPQNFHNAPSLSWPFTPAIHLLDDDVFFENTLVLIDQVKTAHAYAPGANIAITPIVLNTRPGTEPDPRVAGQFGAAWSVSAIKQLALAGVGDAKFAFGPGVGESIQQEIAVYAGKSLRATQIESSPGAPSPVDVLAIDTGDAALPVVYLVNRTDKSVTVDFIGTEEAKPRKVSLAPYGVQKMIGK